MSPSSLSFDALGDTSRVTGTVLDQYGDPMPGMVIVWASNDATVATVNQSGLVTSRRDGSTEIRAQAGTERGVLSVEVAQAPRTLEALEGDHQSHWTGFLLRNPLKVRLADGAGTPVVGKAVEWEVLEGEGTVIPEATGTDSEGTARAAWALGKGDSGVQRVSATVGELDPVVFEATGSAAISLVTAGTLSAPMLDTISATLLALDSLGARQSGIPVEFRGLTGFGEIVQGPTTTDISGELVVRWALGPTPGPQKVTAVRGDIGADLDMAAEATGELDPWPFTMAAPGFYHTCAIDAGGAGFCWGSNAASQLGTEDTLAVVKPGPVPGALVWAEIDGGESHTCGLTAPEGEVYCWGEGLQTGQGAVELTPVPSIVPGGPWSSLTLGANHTCAVKPDGKGWCWGEELEGRLGNGVLEPTGDPTRVSGIQVWSRLSGGHFHTCGLAQDGRGYCWGQGTYGQLGSGGITNQGAPVLVAGGIIWSKISAGRYHTCGISNGGDAYCWGEAGFNQLGNGSTVRQTSPVKVAGEHKWTDIDAGQWHSCGVDQNKKLYCWGRAGSIGIGEYGAPTPVVVLPAYDWVSVQTQGIHTCAITSNGETYCWGSNTFGQLGIGNTTDFNVPRMVFRGVILP